MPARSEDSLVDRIANSLRRDLEAGVFRAGDKLPSENELTRLHSVSRAVVREAIAALRADGLVEARKGAGVFALDLSARPTRPFDDLTTARSGHGLPPTSLWELVGSTSKRAFLAGETLEK